MLVHELNHPHERARVTVTSGLSTSTYSPLVFKKPWLAAARTQVRSVCHDAGPGEKRPDTLGTSIRGRVVDNHDVKFVPAFSSTRALTQDRELSGVVVHNYDGEFYRSTSGCVSVCQ